MVKAQNLISFAVDKHSINTYASLSPSQNISQQSGFIRVATQTFFSIFDLNLKKYRDLKFRSFFRFDSP